MQPAHSGIIECAAWLSLLQSIPACKVAPVMHMKLTATVKECWVILVTVYSGLHRARGRVSKHRVQTVHRKQQF